MVNERPLFERYLATRHLILEVCNFYNTTHDMATCVKSYIDPSQELSLMLFEKPAYVLARYGNLKLIESADYLKFLRLTGDFLVEANTGRLLADFSKLDNFSVNLIAVAINNFKSLISDRAPFLLLAIVMTKESWTDPAMHLALEVARPLSRKFLDGQIFKDHQDALQWLLDYPVPGVETYFSSL